MELGRMLAELTHRTQYGDPPLDLLLRAQAAQGRGHRRRIGVVAFVDQQHLTAVDLDHMPFAAALETAEIGEREPGQSDVGADRLDRGKDRERIRHPMLAALRDGEGQLALEQGGADQASAAFRGDGVDGVDVGVAPIEAGFAL